MVEGRLQVRDWVDQNGNKRRNTEVVADQVYFGESKHTQTAAGAEQTKQRSGFTEEQDADDGELPF